MRVRMTLRRSMGFVALIALGLFLYEEFQDGSPPRFVVRSIPDRIARLRPGMTYEEAEAILGLEKSWLRGGVSAEWAGDMGMGPVVSAIYSIGPIPLPATTPIAGAAPTPPPLLRSAIDLDFTWEGDVDWRRSKSTRLITASFSVDGRLVAEMVR